MKDHTKSKKDLMVERADLRQRLDRLETLEFEHEHMKERFHEMEARYKALFDRSIHCIYMHDLEGKFLDANAAALKLLGYEKDEIGSLDFASLLDDGQVRDAYKVTAAVLGETAYKGVKEYRLRTKDGRHVWVETDASVIYRDGKPYALQGVAKDITVRKQAEQASRESERKFRALFNDSGDGIYMTTREGRFIEANTALLSLFGYTKEELINEIDVRTLYCHPEARVAFQKQIEADRSVRGYPVKFRRKDGTAIDCLVTSSVIRSSDGTVEGYQGIVRDVSDQNRAEAALREREAQYRAIVEAFDGLIYICSRDYRVEFMNRQFIERTGHDGTGELCYKAIHDLDSICPWCVNERVFQGETVRWEVLSPKDNRWLYVVNTPIYHANGEISKQAMILDITDRKKMEQDLQESMEKMKLFAYSVSHDLKSPAIGTYGFAKRLSERYGSSLDDRGRHYCDQILAASEQIAELAEQINLFIAAKEVPLNIESVNVKEVLQMIREEFSSRLNVRQIHWQEPEHIPEINADRISLVRIFRNLVDNALKYGGEDLTEICVDYGEMEGRHVLSVRDNGVGMNQEDTKKLFDVFMRRKSSKGIQGTGLGLAIVKEIAERHGGKVWVMSGQEKGTTFNVSISNGLPLPQ
jgi:PAS domain S-box-containing protein